jgi:hypothetical protein
MLFSTNEHFYAGIFSYEMRNFPAGTNMSVLRLQIMFKHASFGPFLELQQLPEPAFLLSTDTAPKDVKLEQ